MSEASKPDTPVYLETVVIDHIRGFAAYVLHPPNGYLQPICTLVLALAVMSVGGSIARDAQNREMCARFMAFIGRDRQDPQRQAALKKLADRIDVTPRHHNAVMGFCSVYRS